MTLESALLAGRAAAESRMLDTFEIGIPTDGVIYDGDKDVEALEPLFTTKGRVKVAGGVLGARQEQVGERTAVEVTRQLHIPVNSPAIPAGAVAVCTEVHPTSDPTLLGARLRLSGPAPGSQTTARRLEVTEVIA